MPQLEMTTWLQHVKKVHASGSTSFKESLKRASSTWKKTKGAKSDSAAAPKKKRGRKKKAAAVEEKASTPEPEAPVKKKRRRKAKKSTPKIPAAAFTSVDSRNL